MSEVYLAYDADLHCPVAVKVLPEELAKNSTFVGRFRREAEVGQKIDHPNVVRCLEAGQDTQSGRRYLVMEYVKGQSAQAVLERDGPIPLADATRVVIDIARALEELHHKGYVHRDVKPGNILVTEDGRAKLADLGVAKPLADSAELTSFDQGVGTPYYMPWEQTLNASLVDARSDLFALGATFYHLITGRVPFPGKDVAEVSTRKGDGTFTPVRELNPALPRSIDSDPVEVARPDAEGPVPVGRPAYRRPDRVRAQRTTSRPARRPPSTALPPAATRPDITLHKGKRGERRRPRSGRSPTSRKGECGSGPAPRPRHRPDVRGRDAARRVLRGPAGPEDVPPLPLVRRVPGPPAARPRPRRRSRCHPRATGAAGWSFPSRSRWPSPARPSAPGSCTWSGWQLNPPHDVSRLQFPVGRRRSAVHRDRRRPLEPERLFHPPAPEPVPARPQRAAVRPRCRSPSSGPSLPGCSWFRWSAAGTCAFRPLVPIMVGLFAAMNALFISAIALGTSANAILLQNTAPFFVYVVAVFVLGEPADRRSLYALLVGMVGMVVIVGGAGEFGGGFDVMLMGLGSGLTYAGIILCLRHLRTESSQWLIVQNHLGSALFPAPPSCS